MKKFSGGGIMPDCIEAPSEETILLWECEQLLNEGAVAPERADEVRRRILRNWGSAPEQPLPQSGDSRRLEGYIPTAPIRFRDEPISPYSGV